LEWIKAEDRPSTSAVYDLPADIWNASQGILIEDQGRAIHRCDQRQQHDCKILG
jgi:hypothetical protein